jgi:hypothetical protein
MQKPTRAQRVCPDCGAAVQFEIPDGARYRDYLSAAMAKHRSRVWGNCPGSPWAGRGEAPRLPSVAPAGRCLVPVPGPEAAAGALAPSDEGDSTAGGPAWL